MGDKKPNIINKMQNRPECIFIKYFFLLSEITTLKSSGSQMNGFYLVVELYGLDLFPTTVNCILSCPEQPQKYCWADAFYKSICPSVCLCVCVFVHLFTFEVPFKRFFPPLPKVKCQKFLKNQNPWGKEIERNCLRFENFY